MKVEYALIANVLGGSFYNNINIAQGYPLVDSFYKPLFLEFNNNCLGCFIALDIMPDDCISKTGIIKARKQFLQALKYAVEKLNVKIVLLAASTKRLFGKEIELRVNWTGNLDDSCFTLQELYPDILYTNGDNGTAVILNLEIDSILQKVEIIAGNNIVIINGLGLLGIDSLQYLIEKGLNDNQIIVISNYTNDLKELTANRQIKIFPNIGNIEVENKDKIKAIINCTHNPTSLITAENLKQIQNSQSIHVIDVAVPYGFTEKEFLKCHNICRQDGGNAYIDTGLEFFFNPELSGLTEKVLYGCFAETVALSAYIHYNSYIRNSINSYDFFNVNEKTKGFIRELFKKYGIGIALEPFCFNIKENIHKNKKNTAYKI